MAVNVKMGVDLSSFTSGIQEGQRIMRGLNQEMKTAEAEFKATGDAEKKLSDNVKTLNSQLEVQRGIADQAQQALDKMTSAGVQPTDKAYQKMYTTLLKAKEGMNEAQAKLNELDGSNKTTKTSADELAKSVNSIGQSMNLDQAVKGIKGLTDGLENAARTAVRLGKAIAKSAMDSTEWADDVLTRATQFGTDAETVQRMDNVAEYIDTSVDAIMNAKSKLAKNSGNLAELLGISTDGKSVDKVFWEAGDAIMNMSDAFDKEEIAQKVFGRGWKELLPLFTAGQEEYERLMAQQNVLSNEQVDSLGKADDAFKSIQQQIELLKNQFWADNAGTITELLQWLVDNKDTVVTAIEVIAGGFGALKLAEGGLQVLQLINGLKGLTGAAAAASAAGTAAGGAFASGFTSAFVAAAPALAGILGITAVAITPALMVQEEQKKIWQDRYTNRMNSASFGSDNSDFISRAATALGVDGQVDFGSAYELLMGLGARQNQQKAELYNVLKNAADTNGNNTWNLLNALWGGAELDHGQVDKLLQNVTDAMAASAQKAEVPVDLEVPENAAEQLANQVGTVTIPVTLAGVEDGSHANGLWSVPYNGYLARLHKGERIIPAREVASRSYNSNLYVENMNMNGGADAAGLAAAMAAAQRRTMSAYGS